MSEAVARASGAAASIGGSVVLHSRAKDEIRFQAERLKDKVLQAQAAGQLTTQASGLGVWCNNIISEM